MPQETTKIAKCNLLFFGLEGKLPSTFQEEKYFPPHLMQTRQNIVAHHFTGQTCRENLVGSEKEKKKKGIS